MHYVASLSDKKLKSVFALNHYGERCSILDLHATCPGLRFGKVAVFCRDSYFLRASTWNKFNKEDLGVMSNGRFEKSKWEIDIPYLIHDSHLCEKDLNIKNKHQHGTEYMKI